MRQVVVPTYFSVSQPISTVLEQYAAAGVRLVELHGDAPETHIDLTDDAAVDELSRVVRGLPLEIYSVHSEYSRPSEEVWDISQPDEAKRSAALRNHMKVIKASARLGAHHVVVHPGVRSRGGERLSHSCAGLGRLAESARDARTGIAVENLPPDFLGGSVAEVECMLAGLDASVVGLCLDTGHAMLGREAPGDYVRALGSRIFGIHWHTNDGSSDAHLLPDVHHGEWDDFFTALDEVGCRVPVTLEVDFPAATPLEEALRAVRAAVQGRLAP